MWSKALVGVAPAGKTGNFSRINMSEVSKSFLAAGGVIAAVATLYGGTRVRDRVDGVAISPASHEVQSFVASRDNTEVPEGDYFYQLSELVKRDYVEPITSEDDQKLASGAVRGMISSLGDPKSLYMDASQFKVYLAERQGNYQGIGAEMELVLPGKPGRDAQAGLQPSDGDPEEAAAAPFVPKLTVLAVTPGGPADRAGVKPGDTVAEVAQHWVVSSDLVIKFRKAQEAFDKKEIDAAQFNKIRLEIHAKTQRALLPLRALDRLNVGTSGSVDVVWNRGGTTRDTVIPLGESHMPEFAANASNIVLPFTSSTDGKLKQAIAGKSEVTIDLRNNVLGDFGEMKKCLAVLAPSGDYGRVISVHSPRGTSLDVAHGNANPPKINLVVDRTTRGAAEIFALALSTHHLATLSGSDTGGDRSIQQIVQLPDGSGYTLYTGQYEPLASSTTVMNSKKRGRA